MRAATLVALLLWVGAVLARPPADFTRFLAKVLSDAPQLTKHQAEAVMGVWDLGYNRRVEGQDIDKAVLEAQSSGGNVAGAVDAAMSGMPPGVKAHFWVPAVDHKTGLYAAYYLITKNGKLADITRELGVAVGQSDGSVLLTGANSEDTSSMQAMVKGSKMAMLWIEGLQVLDKNSTTFQPGDGAGYWSNMPTVVDNQVATFYKAAKLAGKQAKAVERQIGEGIKTLLSGTA